MNHRSLEHPTTQICRYFKAGTCNHSADECWYSHEKTSFKIYQTILKRKLRIFRKEQKTLPPDMNLLVNQLLKIVSEIKN